MARIECCEAKPAAVLYSGLSGFISDVSSLILPPPIFGQLILLPILSVQLSWESGLGH